MTAHAVLVDNRSTLNDALTWPIRKLMGESIGNSYGGCLLGFLTFAFWSQLIIISIILICS